MKNQVLFLLAVFSILFGLNAHSQNNVRWSADIKSTTSKSGEIIVKAQVDNHYHFYAIGPTGGINATTIDLKAENDNVKFGTIQPSIKPVTEYVEIMDETLSYWDQNVSFTIPYEITSGVGAKIEVKIRFQVCTDDACFAPQKEVFNLLAGSPAQGDVESPDKSIASNVQTTTLSDKDLSETENIALLDSAQTDTSAVIPLTNQSVYSDLITQWWQPVEVQTTHQDSSPWSILILGFLGGLAALLTPCVWPMIPMTLSFFLKKGKAKAKSRIDAIVYGLSIVVIYLVLGLAITLIFGAGKLNELSTSAIFNIFFFLLLVVFAISFFGAFDIKLPSKWSNAIDNKAETTTGFISIFFMAFTLALVSFSCTGPIIGTLLVEAASQGNLVGPALGMGGFALGLALPFSLFAFFPGMLKEMPKSGGWLNTVKVVLGFIELILSLKFLSVADMAYQWHILDREVFLVIWIVLFVMLGLYLIGKIRFAHDDKSDHVSIFKFFLSIISFSFAVYLLPGLWGAPLKAVSAFVPPLETQDFNLYVHNTNYLEFDDYDEGMAYAYEHNIPVLMDFSGYGCVNCRNMEAEVFDTDKVREFVANNLVVIKLMVDERTELRESYNVEVNGKPQLIETLGEKWTYLQTHKFGASSQPYYVILDNYGNPMNEPMYYTNNIDVFMNWMERGLQKYQEE